MRTLNGHTSHVASVKFEPSKGTLLLSGSADRTVRLWKHDTSELVFTGEVVLKMFDVITAVLCRSMKVD